jgi:hypothetical protein
VIYTAVSLAAACLAIARAAFAAAVTAFAVGGLGRGREGQGDNRHECEEYFFHILSPLRFRSSDLPPTRTEADAE